MKRILIALGVILIIALFVFLNLKKSGKAFTVKVETVKKQKVVRIVRADGEVRARNQVEVGSDVMGRIVRILVSEGDVVERGDTLCLIDPSIYEAKVNQLEARLMSDKARLSKVEKDYIRAKKLWRKGLISESAFEEMMANYNTTLAQMRADSFALEEAREDLSKTVITSPVSGEVMRVYKEEGEMTVVGTINTPGSVIMVVADLSEMQVAARVDESEIVSVKPGQRVRVKVDAHPDHEFTGKVLRIAGIPQSQLGQEGVSYPVVVGIESSDKSLLPGMSASCEIEVAVRDSALAVPLPAVGKKKVEGEMRDVVFRVKGGIAELTPVELGITGEKVVEVVSGLSEGDTVIVGPFKVLRSLEGGETVKTELEGEEENAD
ncbi:MAG: efflux RND transporter periplasmic adaptor subunit, partial [Candidatus Hydrothermae bacterium]|nr:efflux RND transporter periplasmic adaptor subunit [Candidatus Hydrothermae bacterium]